MNETWRDFLLSLAMALVLAAILVSVLAMLVFGTYPYLSQVKESDLFRDITRKMSESHLSSALTLDVFSPSSVEEGDDFRVRVLLDNVGKKDIYVTEIHVPSCLQTHADFIQVFPTPSRIESSDEALVFYYDDYSEILLFSERVIENTSKKLTFEFVAASSGRCEGDILVYVGNKYASHAFSIKVEP